MLVAPNGQPAREQILDDLKKLRRAIGGLVAEKKQYGPNFPVKSAKDLAIKLRKAADEIDMPIAGAIVRQEYHEVPRGVDREGREVGTATHIISTVRFESADGSFREFVGSGHGMDPQDKAGGKASTYSWKDAVTKALCLPDKEMVDTDDENGVLGNEEVIPKTPVKKSPKKSAFVKRGAK